MPKQTTNKSEIQIDLHSFVGLFHLQLNSQTFFSSKKMVGAIDAKKFWLRTNRPIQARKERLETNSNFLLSTFPGPKSQGDHANIQSAADN